ncbi:sulfotransferase [bacterium]|nr:sulfotransferase [bacterium]
MRYKKTTLNILNNPKLDCLTKKIVFVVGVGRSGTSLTQLLLASHPDITFLPEINFIRRFAGKNLLTKGCVKDKEQLIRLLLEDEKVQRLPFCYRQEIAESIRSDNPEKVFLNSILNNEQFSKSNYIGIKDARLIEHGTTLLNTFKNARIVHVYRDPRDVLASKKKAAWSRDNSLWRNLASGRIQLDAISKTRNSDFSHRLFDIKYEDLLMAPEANLRKLCSFLQIEYTSEMLDFHHNTSGLVFQDEMQYKKNLLNPLMKNNAGKWKSQLTDFEIIAVEALFAKELTRFDYQLADFKSPLSLRQKVQRRWLLTQIKLASLAYQPILNKANAGIGRLR